MSTSEKLLVNSGKIYWWSLRALVVASIFTLSCLKGDRRSQNEGDEGFDNSANFLVAKLEGTPLQQQLDEVWAIPKSNRYRLTACIKNLSSNDNLVGQPFRVIGDNWIQDVGVTDGGGCIEWFEEVHFNYFAENPSYILFERTLHGTGRASGRRKVQFVIDPWKRSRESSNDEFIFAFNQSRIPPNTVREKAQVFSALSKGKPHQLLVKDFRVQSRDGQFVAGDAGQGFEVKMNFLMKPYFVVEKDNGIPTSVPIRKGRFRVYAQVVATEMGPNRNETFPVSPQLIGQDPRTNETFSQFEGGREDLQVFLKPFLWKYWNQQGNLMMAVRVEPIGLPDVEPFQTTFLVGDFNQRLASNTLQEYSEFTKPGDGQPISKHSFDQLMGSFKRSPEDLAELATRLNIKQVEPYLIDEFKISFNGIEAETSTWRKVAFNINTKVKFFAQSGREAAHQKFRISRYVEVKDENGVMHRQVVSPPKIVSTGENGQLVYSDAVTHAYYAYEHYFRSKVVIESAESEVSETSAQGEVKGFRKEIEIAINPWDLFATFGRDLRFYDGNAAIFQPPTDELGARKIESVFNLANFSYTTIRFDYRVNEDLSLQVKKYVLLQLFPEVQRRSSIVRGRLAVEPLRDGIWLMKVALHKDYLDPTTPGAEVDYDEERQRPIFRYNENLDPSTREYISYQEKLVRVINGRVITPVMFEMEDLRLMRIRSNLLIQLEPIDETKLALANVLANAIDESTLRAKDSSIDEELEETIEQVTMRISNSLSDLDTLRTKVSQFLKPSTNIQSVFSERLARESINQETGQRDFPAVEEPAIDCEVTDVTLKNPACAAQEERMGRERAAIKHYYEERSRAVTRLLDEMDNVGKESLINGRDNSGTNGLRDLIISGDITSLNEKIRETIVGARKSFETPVSSGSAGGQGGVNRPLDEQMLHQLSADPENVETGDSHPFTITDKILRRLQVNDFTKEATAPIVNLSRLVEPFEISGLRRRTFIGPMTFLLNTNSSQVRATDELDEVFCISRTCSVGEIEEWELKELNWRQPGEDFSLSKYYGSVAHFFNKHVDDLIFRYEGGRRTRVVRYRDGREKERVEENLLGLKKESELTIKARGLLTNYLALNNLDFVSMGNDPLFRLDRSESCQKKIYDPSCLVESNDRWIDSRDFASQLTSHHAQFLNIRVDPQTSIWFWARPLGFDGHLAGNGGGLGFYRADNGKGFALNGESDSGEAEETLAITAETIEQRFRKIFSGERARGNFGLKIDEELGARFCFLMADRKTEDLAKFKLRTSLVSLRSDLFTGCAEEVLRRGGLDFYNSVLQVAPHYRVKKVAEKRFLGGKSLNVNVQNSFALNSKESVSYKRSLDFLGPARAIFDVVAGGGRFSPFSGWGLQSSIDRGRDLSNGMAVQKGTYLVVQTAALDLKLSDYERCITMRISPDAMSSHLKQDHYFSKTNYSERELEQLSLALTSGLLICEGEANAVHNPVVGIRERYFYLTQHFTEGDMLDFGDLYNHPWLLKIRGMRDFSAFMSSVQEPPEGERVSVMEVTVNGHQPVATEHLFALDQMVRTYSSTLPAFPGFYSPIPGDPYRDFPWNQPPDRSFCDDCLGIGSHQEDRDVPLRSVPRLLGPVRATVF